MTSGKAVFVSVIKTTVLVFGKNKDDLKKG
jgi:hypothetical protein